MRRLLGLLALAACNTPAPSLHIRLAGPDVQACPSTDCSAIPLQCASYMSVRIIDPSDPAAPFLSQCTPIPFNGKRDMCSLSLVDLEQKPLPIRELEVQVAVYPASALATDPMTGQPTCPTDVEYDASRGFPVERPDTPALGGRSYYHPGDEQIIVTLGCTNLEKINDMSCVGATTVHVAATIEDFDTHLLVVSPGIGDRLSVSVAEPVERSGMFEIDLANARFLTRSGTGQALSWASDVNLAFQQYACLQVLEDGAQSTTSLTCRDGVADARLFSFAPGYRLSRATLQQILTALGATEFPPQGLTVGILLDANDFPIANAAVTASTGTVRYLSANRTSFGATRTSTNGIFVSTDAPFGTVFASGMIGTPTGIGGLVTDKVTVVVLRPPGINPDPNAP